MAEDFITFDVPNLDCASIDPSDYRKLATTLTELAWYANVKAEAMEARLKGQADAELERLMDRSYKGLPEWARW